MSYARTDAQFERVLPRSAEVMAVLSVAKRLHADVRTGRATTRTPLSGVNVSAEQLHRPNTAGSAVKQRRCRRRASGPCLARGNHATPELSM